MLLPAQFALFTQVEPIGGGPSGWMAQLQRTIEAARQSKTTTAPAKPPGG
jgi:hypothetical protein